MIIKCPKCNKEMRYYKENHWGAKLHGLKCPDHDIFMDLTAEAPE